MVLPDWTRFAQDRRPGLVRRRHKSIASRRQVYRNLPDLAIETLASGANVVVVLREGGTVLGVRCGRRFKIFYEFDGVEVMRQELAAMLDEVGQFACEDSAASVMTLDFSDFPHRHLVEPILRAAGFDEPAEFALMRCTDVGAVAAPGPSPAVRVREAREGDAGIVVALEERLAGEDAMAPPLPSQFFADALWVGVAEVAGRPAGYMRIVDGEGRGMVAEEFRCDGDAPAAALVQAVCEYGRRHDRRALSVRVASDAVGEPFWKAHGFGHQGRGLIFSRPVDPAEVRRRQAEKVTGYVKVGKIFGRF